MNLNRRCSGVAGDLSKAVKCCECQAPLYVNRQRSGKGVTCLRCINVRRIRWGMEPVKAEAMKSQREA